MSACNRAKAQMPSYLEGDLAPRQRAELERHLAQCARCQRERELLEESLLALDSCAAHDRSSIEPPEGMWASVAARLEAEKPARPRLWIPAIALSGAAVAALLLIALLTATKEPIRIAQAPQNPAEHLRTKQVARKTTQGVPPQSRAVKPASSPETPATHTYRPATAHRRAGAGRRSTALRRIGAFHRRLRPKARHPMPARLSKPADGGTPQAEPPAVDKDDDAAPAVLADVRDMMQESGGSTLAAAGYSMQDLNAAVDKTLNRVRLAAVAAGAMAASQNDTSGPL